MRTTTGILLCGLVCILMIITGCTGTSFTTPATTPATATAAPMTATQATGESPSPAAPVLPWTGTWHTAWSDTDNSTVVELLYLTQTGSSVTGTYLTDRGTVNGTVQENRLVGTWSSSDKTGRYTGPFEFVLSDDRNSFTGRWASASDGPDALRNSSLPWDGDRI